MPRRVLLFFILLLLAAPAHAHPEGFSGFRFLIYPDKAKAILTLHVRDMSAWFPPAKYDDYSAAVTREIIATPADVLEVRFDDATIQPSEKHAFVPEIGMIQVELTYPITTMPRGMTVWSKCLVRLPRGHQQLFFAEDMRRDPKAESGKAIYEATLSTEEDNASFDIPQPPTTQAASQPLASSRQESFSSRREQDQKPSRIDFFSLGVWHILTGYDHLLFLAALLLVSKSFKEAASVVTFFTVAHSITLTLAALDIVRMPGRFVEPAIAATILYVGVENVVHKHKVWSRAAIAFGFGLIHGLGFASDLRQVGLGTSAVGIVMPLLKFSAGLESCQLILALLTLQLMLLMRKTKAQWFERRLVPACSILIAAIGAFWLIQRVAAG